MKSLTDDSLMPFGKYKGVKMEKVPASYLHWLWNNGLKQKTKESDVAAYISENKDSLAMENKDLIWD